MIVTCASWNRSGYVVISVNIKINRLSEQQLRQPRIASVTTRQYQIYPVMSVTRHQCSANAKSSFVAAN